MLEQCNDFCGWTSGIVAALSFGSFGVPIKLISNVKVDPLVMQSYKSFVCFLTCWVVLLLGEPLKFSPWGILSGLFWVPGATAGIYGIRNAGLAISAGTWSSLIVISSFCWGIFIFGEKVKSIQGASGAAFTLILGLIGMSVYSSPPSKSSNAPIHKKKKEELFDPDLKKPLLLGQETSISVVTNGSMDASDSDDDVEIEPVKAIELTESFHGHSNIHIPQAKPGHITRRKKVDEKKKKQKKVGVKSPSIAKIDGIDITSTDLEKANEDKDKSEEEVSLFDGKIRMTRRSLGIAGAVINGVWGGNNMIPLHYASKQGFHGAGYLISYSVGSMLVTVLMWIFRYLYNLYCWDYDYKQAYNALPSFHVREMWLAGFIAGGLYSFGNLCSILVVTSLGQGVGYSFVQTSMLVSGLWGIFFFGEVQGFDRILKWLASSVITIFGILWLSYEHQPAVAH